MNFVRALKRIAGGYAQVGTAERIAGHAGIGRSPVSDAAYAVQASDVYVAVTKLTAARTLTLPAAASYPPGQPLDIGDESGSCSSTLTVSLALTGSDTVNGGAAAPVFTAPFFRARLFSDGVSNWSTGVLSVAGGGTGTGQAGGGALDNVLGIAGAAQAAAAVLVRTAAATYSFVASSSFAASARKIVAGAGLAGGGDLTADRTLSLSWPVNPQTGTSYTLAATDAFKLVTFNNAGAVAVTLPQAGASFPNGFETSLLNLGVGTVTITPATSTVNGAASLVLTMGQSADLYSDGTNYFAAAGSAAAASSSGGLTRSQAVALAYGDPCNSF